MGGTMQESLRTVGAGTRSVARCLSVVGVVCALLWDASSARAQSFAQTYEAATCNAGALASDPVGDENPSRIDAVGNATDAAALYANDATYYYMRQRLADDPSGPGGYASHAWSWGIDTDGNEANGFELVASLDGVPELVKLLPAGSSTPLWSASTATHADAVVAGSSVGGGTDYFLTIAVPIQVLNDNGATGSLKIWLGSSANASGIDKDWACFAGVPTSPADVPMDAVEVPTKCVVDADCGGSTPICDGTDQLCVPCSSDVQCAAIDPAKGICAPSGACVAGCTDDSDCSGDTPVCNTGTNVCEACSGNAQCVGIDADTPICDPSGSCDACVSNAQCAGIDADTPICDPSGSCDACASNAQCLAIDANAPVCGTSGSCDPCSSNLECATIDPGTPFCSAGGACTAGCTGDGDCPGGASVCDLSEVPAACEPADTCGNNRVESGESCDDGSNAAGDGCGATCLLEDGEVCAAGTDCESGVCDATEDPDVCESADTCGNGTVESGEGCDDGGVTPGDGCNASCLKELGESCGVNAECASAVCDTLGSNTCEPADTCGNGEEEAGEFCDDGNTVSGDCCTSESTIWAAH